MKLKLTPERLYLTGLIGFLLGWDIWAILLDQRLKAPDTFVMATIQLMMDLREWEIWRWLGTLGPKGPIGSVLSLPFLAAGMEVPAASRIITVFAHGALTLQSYDLARLVYAEGPDVSPTAARRAGLWAALLCGTCPFLFGVCRLSYHDVLLAVGVIGAMQVMLRARMDRPGPAALLGLVLGLGLLTKHSFSLYMVGPGLWFVARRLRGVRSGLYFVLMGLVMIAVAAVWLIPNFEAMKENLEQNSGLPSVSWAAELGFYLSLPGALPLFVAASISAVALAVRRRISLWTLALLLTFIPMVLSLHTVTAAARYMIPVIPMWAVLSGCGLAWALSRLDVKPRALALGGATAALAVLFVYLNLTGVTPPPPIGGTKPQAREDYGGIISPDTRKHDGWRKAVSGLRPDEDVLLAYDSNEAFCERLSQEIIWHRRGVRTNFIHTLADAKKRLAEGRTVAVLYIRGKPDRPLQEKIPPDMWHPVRPGEFGGMADLIRRVSWLASQKQRQLVTRSKDPDGYAFEAYRVAPAGAPPARPLQPSPTTDKKQGT